MSGPVICTIAAGNYLPFVRVLAKSFRAHNPKTPLKVLLAGTEADTAVASGVGLDIIRPQDLNLPGLHRMTIHYDAKQLCAALKPPLLRHLLKQGYGPVMFLDPDILVTDSLDPVFERIGRHSLTVTRHLRRLSPELYRVHLERVVLLGGIYNAGFIGVTARDETLRFLDWWTDRLERYCLPAKAKGIHYDQRWLDLAAGFVADFHILRDPGCNVGFWNIRDVAWEIDGPRFRVDGGPLRFFHFTGFDPLEPERISRHVSDATVDALGPLASLFRDYAALVKQAGFGTREPSSGMA